MAENKTKPTEASPESYIAAIEDEARRKDCQTLARLMAKATKQKAKMWGTSIVGFGTHKYQLAGGREGEICAVGFSSRKGDISIYGVAGEKTNSELLGKLGKHKLGKGCLYISKLAEVELKILEQLVANAVKAKQA
ncbi:MAG: DUF1801 domain-containing protein [Thermoguttaceae bacterium]